MKGRAGTPYIPALGFDWLTRFYDPVVRVGLKGEKFKHLLVDQCAPLPGQRVLDLGCGTATLTILLKRASPSATVIGLDGDPKILGIARRKAAAAGVDIELCEGTATDPPFEGATFDRIVSSLLLHHLTTAEKTQALRCSFELLRASGEIHIADWGKPQNALMRATYLVVQLVDGFETTRDNLSGRLPYMLGVAGFTGVTETHREMTILVPCRCFAEPRRRESRASAGISHEHMRQRKPPAPGEPFRRRRYHDRRTERRHERREPVYGRLQKGIDRRQGPRTAWAAAGRGCFVRGATQVPSPPARTIAQSARGCS